MAVQVLAKEVAAGVAQEGAVGVHHREHLEQESQSRLQCYTFAQRSIPYESIRPGSSISTV